ncbi:hypothetical protein M413DRAFT_14958 [Hebeloma cylindrosporum]|uniref:Uncharacterized protein n=1 Tax=Hebeloma cylindrosporum TaxID=76867 RepID=A0A0C2Y0N6_HEBCY|nr:hypothetical protein M413DRAFT_14958 [Hebeloma cylindrosporum h7]
MQREPYNNATSLRTAIDKKTKTAIVTTMAKKLFPEEFRRPLFCLKFLMSFQKAKGAGKLGPEFLAAQQRALQEFMAAAPTGQPQRPPQQPVAGPSRMQPPPAPRMRDVTPAPTAPPPTTVVKVNPMPHVAPKATPKPTAPNPIRQTRIPTAEMERMSMADKPPARLERRLASLEEEMDVEEEPRSSRTGSKRKRTPEDDEDYMREDEEEGEYEEERQTKTKTKKKGREADVSKQRKARPTGKMYNPRCEECKQKGVPCEKNATGNACCLCFIRKIKCRRGNDDEGKPRKRRNAPVPDSDDDKRTKPKESRRAKAQYTSSDGEDAVPKDAVPKDAVPKDAAGSAIKHRRGKGD